MATISRIGYGQVEPNHFAFQRTGQIYAQLPAASTINQLENGQFVKYDYEAGKVNLTGDGEWMLVFNEVKLYDGWRDHYKDFAMIKTNYSEEVMTPRVCKTNIGDIYTTNCVGAANTGKDATYAGVALVVGDQLKVDSSTGFLIKGTNLTAADAPVFNVVKIDTMPDGQAAVKLQRIM